MTAPEKSLVLVLDDDRSTRAIVRFALQNDYEVIEAGRIAEARKLLAERPVSLMVCDGLLPDGSGVDLLREVRKEGNPVRVIFLSSFFKDLATFKALKDELGVVEVLHKPITPETLAGHVRAALPKPQ